MRVSRATDAKRVNEIVNDPSIYPWVKGEHTSPLDLTKVIADSKNVALLFEHGCVLFIWLQPGIYEFHASVLPEGRGEWMHEASQEAFRWMFTQTDAFELMTKCPDGNVLAKAGAKNVGCRLQFITRPIWPTDNGKVCVDVYSLMIQDWAAKAPGLEEVGHWFHETLIAEYARVGKSIDVVADDATHDRYVGAAVEIFRGGQTLKAVRFYNRWAALAGYAPLCVVSANPLVFDISEAKIRVVNNSFEVM